jgi:hypothetical protein
VTVSPGLGLAGEKVNEATGGWLGEVTVIVWEAEFVAPRLSVTVRVTVYVPAAE